ncbi:MAG: Type II secretion system protein F [Legionellaceae bacterium]
MNKHNKRMKTYIWIGKNSQGKIFKGEMNGLNSSLIKAELYRQHIIPLKIKLKTHYVFSLLNQKITSKEITLFTRQLATLLSAGISLTQALDIIKKGQIKLSLQSLISVIKKDLEAGHPFFKTLRFHPQYFNELYCNCVKVGEYTGSLDIMLTRIASHKEKMELLKKRVQKALFYPATIMSIALTITLFLILFIIPQFDLLFKNFGSELPPFTQFIILLSSFFKKYGLLMLGFISISIVGLLKARKKFPLIQYKIDTLLLHLPFLKTIIVKAIIVKFARTLAITFSAGLPLNDTLKIIADITPNSIYKHAIMDIRNAVINGQRLQIAMEATYLFPTVVNQMIGIGEESGTLEFMLNKIADLFEEEIQYTIDNLSCLFEPIILIIVGILIGSLVIAMYLPIFKLGNILH